MAGPPLAKRNDRFIPNTGDDPAAMIVNPSRFRKPQLISGDRNFTWPIGIEGFRVAGRATLGVHRPIGRNAVSVSVIHLDEGRISLDGEFAGLTAVENMVKLRDVCMAAPPANGKLLILPGVFEEVQYVMVEEHDFTHDQDDRTHSIAYNISMIRIGSQGDADQFATMTAPAQPGNSSTPRGEGSPNSAGPNSPGSTVTIGGTSVYLTTSSTATLREIAQLKLGSADKWPILVEYNRPIFVGVASHEIPTMRFPPGTGIIVAKK